ncbi:MAG: sirohydrochlorin chelatase [Puniceicoccales bacterium]
MAKSVGNASGIEVHPVSLMHADRVDADRLGGEPAWTFLSFLEHHVARGAREFHVIPLFLGPSRAITQYIPEQAAAWRVKVPDLRVHLAPCLCPEDGSGDDVVAGILARGVRELMESEELESPRVALVDHGSPVEVVTQVRNRIAHRLADLLGEGIEAVAPCSMERREGERYAFNEPLLEKLLHRPGWRDEAVVVSMLFLQPGRHAGSGGDVAQICARAEADAPALKTYRTRLLGEDPALVELLAERLRQTC